MDAIYEATDATLLPVWQPHMGAAPALDETPAAVAVAPTRLGTYVSALPDTARAMPSSPSPLNSVDTLTDEALAASDDEFFCHIFGFKQ